MAAGGDNKNVASMPDLQPFSPAFVDAEDWGMRFDPELPTELYVSGRDGYNSTMNGYYRQGAVHEGRVHYQHTKGKFVIRWSPRKNNGL